MIRPSAQCIPTAARWNRRGATSVRFSVRGSTETSEHSPNSHRSCTGSFAAGAAQSTGGRAALLRRPERGRDCRSAARVVDDRDARVEDRQSVAVPRADDPEREWTANAGITSISCCSRRSIAPWRSGTSLCGAPAAAMSNWSTKSGRCSLRTTAPTAFWALRRLIWPHVRSANPAATMRAEVTSGPAAIP